MMPRLTPASIKPGPDDLALLTPWLDKMADQVDMAMVHHLLLDGSLHYRSYPDGVVLFVARQSHAEWLAVACDQVKPFVKNHLLNWRKDNGFQTMHWVLPADSQWAWYLPKAGYRLTAQAQLRLDFANPVAQHIYQRQPAKPLTTNVAVHQVHLRSTLDETTDAIADCIQRAYQDSLDMDWHPTIRHDALTVIQQQMMLAQRINLVIAEQNNTVVGVCMGFVYDDPQVTELGFWAVCPEYTGQGVGQQLLACFLGKLPPNTNRVLTYTNTRLSHVIKIYQSFGFELTDWQTIAY